MPIYEYRCTDCDKHVEKMQKISDAPLTVCEECGGRLEKKWSLAGFQFKGAGWYVTDYSNKGKPETKSGAKGEAAPSSPSAGGGDGGGAAEKSSAGESTAAPSGASNSSKSDTSSSKKE